MLKYLETVLESVKPIYVFLITSISYILFPTETYKTSAVVLACAVILDIATKYYALGKRNGGIWNAIKTGHIQSSKLWTGTLNKVFVYLVLMILAGLSVRVSPVEQIATFFSSFVYFWLFLREGQSCLENILYADPKGNAWIKVLLILIKNKKKEITKEANESKTKE